MDYVQVQVTGIVQGVGFRPFIYKKACEYGLGGNVFNTVEGVTIRVSGESDMLDLLADSIEKEAPPAAVIDKITVSAIPPFESGRFEITGSEASGEREVLVSPDLGTCDECVSELFDQVDRRYGYPFINCTNCGPRFTIIERTPYDREYTSMAPFQMCGDCRSEYEDPSSRRFHAQPNACSRCGPRLKLVTREGDEVPGDPVSVTAGLLSGGEIVAIKGLGGFHLACDATSDEVVRELRLRKNRYGKPLAVMVRDIEQAMEYCSVSEKEKALMLSPRRPVVLVEEKEGSKLSRQVAAGLRHQGLFSPYTPLHHLLMHKLDVPLIMTSGNISGEPIATADEEAQIRLGGIADYFLMNNREILVRYDDSVTRIFRGGDYPVRRSRGYAPYPLSVSPPAPVEVLALGPELKNTFCLLRENKAFVGQHIGDMDNALAVDHFEEALETMIRLFSLKPEVVCCDLHPEYVTTQMASDYGLPVVGVQHHHAHIASCMADNGAHGSVIGVAWDGTGYGEDGTVWGGEFLLCDGADYRRLAHLYNYMMPGSDLCIYRIYRMAAGVLNGLFEDPQAAVLRLGEIVDIDSREAGAIAFQITEGVNTPLTSSAGRLFDAAAVFTGLRQTVDYDGQAACELEACAVDTALHYPFEIDSSVSPWIIDTRDVFRRLMSDVDAGVDVSLIAGKFHRTLAAVISQTCGLLSDETGVNRVALSGGVFQNLLLTGMVVDMLEDRGLEVLLHRRVPCNDGGISLGQAVIAAGGLSCGGVDVPE